MSFYYKKAIADSFEESQSENIKSEIQYINSHSNANGLNGLSSKDFQL